MLKYLSFATVAATILAVPLQTLAHSEHDKARFVSQHGQDVGQCDNVLRPCKTIAYAVQQANKGDKVLVAAGTYQISSADELFYLTNALVPVKGGYNRFDHFQNQSPQLNSTSIIGAPVEMAASLEKSGFNVIADGKSQFQNEQFKEKLASYQALSQAKSNVACVSGKAGVHDCQNIDLLSHMPLTAFSSLPSAASDIWGHVDLNTGKEYAIIGLRNGTAVIDISEPTAPVEVGTIPGASVTWRDIKVYQYFDTSINLWQAYAYVTLDGSRPDYTNNVTIINLNNLPHSVNLMENNDVVYKAHNVYLSNVDYSLNTALSNQTPTLQLLGTEKSSGQFQNFSLANPKTITEINSNYISSKDAGSRPYTHDASSITINDSRKDSDCENATTHGCTVLLDFNETEMLLWDITDNSNVSAIGRGSYSDPQYVHSGWSSEDKHYVFLHDELDESRLGLNTTLRIFSIEDLNQPTLVGTWVGDTRAIDHNGFVRGNRYYMSNYERGVTVLDISDPAAPQEIGFFDTFPQSNNANFNGAWGVYPFLPSGTIIVSDINSGLYILKDNTLTSDQGQLSFTAESLDVLPGQQVAVSVQRTKANQDSSSVTVGYELMSGSAQVGQDFVAASGELTWTDNSNGIASINIDVLTPQDNHAKSFFVRLFDPRNGATLSSPSYMTLNIDGNADNSSVSFVQESLKTTENHGALDILVARNGNSDKEISVTYQIMGGTATAGQDFNTATGQLTWAANDTQNKVITLELINDELEEATETLTVQLVDPLQTKLGALSSVSIAINDDDQNTAPIVTLNENFEVNTSQTVTLTAQASDNEQDVMTYLWAQTAGETVTLTDANTLSATFTAPSTAGTLTFSFTATDSKGAHSEESISVTVVAPTTPTTPTTDKPTSSGGGSVSWMVLLLSCLAFYRRKPTH